MPSARATARTPPRSPPRSRPSTAAPWRGQTPPHRASAVPSAPVAGAAACSPRGPAAPEGCRRPRRWSAPTPQRTRPRPAGHPRAPFCTSDAAPHARRHGGPAACPWRWQTPPARQTRHRSALPLWRAPRLVRSESGGNRQSGGAQPLLQQYSPYDAMMGRKRQHRTYCVPSRCPCNLSVPEAFLLAAWQSRGRSSRRPRRTPSHHARRRTELLLTQGRATG
mmetsp:Transcript_4298/g.12111  ORF Transcript_4298/g.12111 Transcript_4298/m.12111 type:complete len:222 (-) Transcript_4298:187-852(-)